MSTKRKLKEEEGQTKLIELFKRTNSPNREAKQRTPPSTEKPKSKRINMDKKDNQQCDLSDKESQPTLSQNPMNQMAFDFAAMEKRIIASYQETIKPLQDSIDVLLAGKKKVEEMTGEFKKLKLENKTITRRCNMMEQENKVLKDRINNIENKLLENNVVMHGVEESFEESETQRKSKVRGVIAHTVNKRTLEERMEIANNIPILWTERLGRYNEHRSRPISVKFEHKLDSDLLIQRRKQLPDGIFVDREYCVETEKERQYLRPVLKEARKKEEFRGKCKMEGPTLVIQGKKYNRENIHQLPEKINGFNCTSKSSEDTICFFGELNPFSNFHPCTFEVAGIKYHSSEQFIQHMKARFFEDQRSSDAILHAVTPRECKRLSKNITGYDGESWAKMAKQLCKPGISAKFFQNPDLARMFEITEDKILVESCYEKLWGTGIPLHHPDCLNKDKWINRGIMSEMLCEIREELLGIRGDNMEVISNEGDTES